MTDAASEDTGRGAENEGGEEAAGWVYSFNVGVEAEAAGREPPKSFVALRRDLAVLPWVLAGPGDIVLAPPPRPRFLASLRDAGVTGLPAFVERVPRGRAVAGHRPYGVPGEHMRRSAVARYRSDVSVCRSMAEVRQAVAAHHKAVLKAEFSSSGLGVRVCEGAAALEPGAPLEKWVQDCLRQDGALTVEPWMDVLAEVTAEWLNGAWMSVSQPIVTQMRWEGQWLGDPVDGGMCREAADFVFKERAVEAALAKLEVPATCGAETCGMDIAIVRATGGCGKPRGQGVLPFLEVRVLELNARTTMSHYAQAAKSRLFCGSDDGRVAQKFVVARLSEFAGLGPDVVPLTDPETASMFVACILVSRTGGSTRRERGRGATEATREWLRLVALGWANAAAISVGLCEEKGCDLRCCPQPDVVSHDIAH